MSMEVNLSDDQRAFIREALESGRIQHEEDAVQEAMLLWEERERRRMHILAAVDAAETSFARGESRTITNREELAQLARDVKQRASARFSVPRDSR
jgi:Arc/MetJ-type ribon-helix-helix transcriptional regulator